LLPPSCCCQSGWCGCLSITACGFLILDHSLYRLSQVDLFPVTCYFFVLLGAVGIASPIAFECTCCSDCLR
jgi:hypothetical protein